MNSFASLNGSLWVCESSAKFPRPRGAIHGDSPLNYTYPVLLVQIILVVTLTTCLQILLTPLGETSFVAQLLAGLILGPSVLGKSETFSRMIFPPKSYYVSETVAFFGTMLFMFLNGVKIDATTVMRTGKRTWAVGLCSFLLPLILSSIAALVLREMISPEQTLKNSMLSIAFFISTGSFHVTAVHLADLKLLNSELGQLAISSSMVNGAFSGAWVISVFSEKKTTLWKDDDTFNWMLPSLLTMVVLILYVFRPIMFWMIRQTPKGQPVKESYIMSIFLMLLVCALYGELIGEHFMVGPIILGLAVPDGPPLASTLVERLDTMVSAIFLPLFFIFSGARFNVTPLDARGFAAVQIVAFFSFCGKIIGTMLPSLYCKMSVTDALSFAFLMSAQGITHMIYLHTALYLLILNGESYCYMVIAMVWLTGAATPMVKFLYDPSKRYLSLNKSRTIEHATPHVELRLMACIHYQENTPSIISLLEMSNPAYPSPIGFYVLHLVQLKGRSSPLFIHHQPGKTDSFHSTVSQPIINAFRSYERLKAGVLVNLFTSISPYATMHNDICMLAADKGVSLLIMPFHRQWTSNGITESVPQIRSLNRRLLRTAPCSIGILVERGTLSRNNPLACTSFYSVGVIFIEGQDDRESLAYAMRMAKHQHVRVTVVRLMEPRRKRRIFKSRDHDDEMIHRFKVDYNKIKHHDYREEIVRDGVEVVNVIRSLEGCYDLILVGRRHATAEASLFRGLSEWNEYPELGVLADMLVSSDSNFDASLLVVQQQKRLGVDDPRDMHLDPSTNMKKEEPLAIVEVPRDAANMRPIL